MPYLAVVLEISSKGAALQIDTFWKEGIAVGKLGGRFEKDIPPPAPAKKAAAASTFE